MSLSLLCAGGGALSINRQCIRWMKGLRLVCRRADRCAAQRPPDAAALRDCGLRVARAMPGCAAMSASTWCVQLRGPVVIG
jgi:hypothetical protein